MYNSFTQLEETVTRLKAAYIPGLFLVLQVFSVHYEKSVGLHFHKRYRIYLSGQCIAMILYSKLKKCNRSGNQGVVSQIQVFLVTFNIYMRCTTL